MEIARFIYQDNPNYEVEFEPSSQDNVMVNATMMAAIFGKDLFQYTKSQQTKSFLKSCLKPANAGLLGIKNKEDLIISRQKSGTWMHRIIALDFASWLDPDFKVWIYITIDKILNQAYREERNARQRKIYAKSRQAALKKELAEKYPDWIEYFDLEDSIRQADNEILKSVKEQVKQLQLEFMPELTNPSQS
jgi:hypothetical protein